MTNKEAIEYIKTDISRLWDTPQNLEHKEALEMAIKALEQKPCKDAISRQAVLNAMRKNHRTGGKDIDGDYIEGDYRESLFDDVKALPPVTPTPKTGHWIFCENLTTYWKEVYKCSECNGEITKTGCWNHHSELEKYCPNCGAKMAESEDEA